MSRSIIRRAAVAGFLVVSGICAAADAQAVTSFNGITSWVGSGPNSAALVIDWNNDPGNSDDISMVWGYRWSGTAYTSNMIQAIVEADPHLYALLGDGVSTADADSNDYDSTFGFGYNQNPSSTFTLSPPPSRQSTEPWSFGANGLPNNLALIPDDGGGVDDSRIATGSGQIWEEGWWVGYWSFWNATNSDLVASVDDAADWDSQWNYSDNGIAAEQLSDGEWDAIDYDVNYDVGDGLGAPPAEPTAAVVPEPAAASLLLLGSLCMLHRPRRRAAAR